MFSENEPDNILASIAVCNKSKRLRTEAQLKCNKAKIIRIKAQVICFKNKLRILELIYMNSNLYRFRVPVEFEL